MPFATNASPFHSLKSRHGTAGPILVAVGGRDAANVVRAARALSQDWAGGVLALSVLEPLPAQVFGSEPPLPPPTLEAEEETALRARLESLVREAVGEEGSWRTDVRLGDPAHVIADVAARENASLIIMGIGRHNLVDRLLQRETAVRTVRLADCPVFAVCGPVTGAPRTVVVGTDFSPESLRAAEAASTVMSAQGEIVLVHAWQSMVVDPLLTEAVAGADAEYVRRLPARFERLRAAVPAPAERKISDAACRGDAALELVRHAKKVHADLIAVGRHGAGAMERLFLGSVTTAVLRHAECSVLVTPILDAAERERLTLAGKRKAELVS